MTKGKKNKKLYTVAFVFAKENKKNRERKEQKMFVANQLLTDEHLTDLTKNKEFHTLNS